jgi:hypothetical protein
MFQNVPAMVLTMVGVERFRAEDVPPGRAPMGFWIAKTVSPQWEGLMARFGPARSTPLAL